MISPRCLCAYPKKSYKTLKVINVIANRLYEFFPVSLSLSRVAKVCKMPIISPRHKNGPETLFLQLSLN